MYRTGFMRALQKEKHGHAVFYTSEVLVNHDPHRPQPVTVQILDLTAGTGLEI